MGRLESQWFHYNGFECLDEMPELFLKNDWPLVGTKATVIWVTFEEKVWKRKEVVQNVCRIVDVVETLNPRTSLWFATHPPVSGPDMMSVVNFNKNLLFAIHKTKRHNRDMKIGSIALHHWCLRQGKNWWDWQSVLETERHMLVFLITDKVMRRKRFGGGVI